MDWMCPGCRIALRTPLSGRIEIPDHKMPNGSDCPRSGQLHTLIPPTTRAPERIAARTAATLAKRVALRKAAAPPRKEIVETVVEMLRHGSEDEARAQRSKDVARARRSKGDEER
jgi:hypothetical protein